MSGPPPKRDEERRRRNKDVVETTTVDIDNLIAGPVTIPVADEEWHPTARQLWDSFALSGQAIFYEPSDWATAYMLIDVLDRWLKPQDIKVGQTGVGSGDNAGGDIDYIFEPKIVAMPGGTLTAILKGLTSLMVTEGDRRRLRIELDRKAARDAAAGGGDASVIPITQKRLDRFDQPQEA